jgi:DMSO/TMAO reductase YedYZ molybdopterin-dependent catalytic subunit
MVARRHLPDGIDPGRVPPGQKPAAPGKWPVFTAGSVPEVDLAAWDFKVFGLVERELTLSYEELLELPVREVTADIHCVTGWSRLGDRWKGVPTQAVLDRVNPLPEARFVMAHCDQGYTANLPLEALDSPDVLLCYGWNGRQLSREHGWPLRLFVPSRFLEVGQVAARPGVHGREPARLLGAARLSRRCRPLEGRAVLVAAERLRWP